jgi:hypothetical protein
MATHSITSRGVDAPAPAIRKLLGATPKRGPASVAPVLAARRRFVSVPVANHDNPPDLA